MTCLVVDLAAAEAFTAAAAWESSLGNHRIAAERRGTERWEKRGRARALKFWTILEVCWEIFFFLRKKLERRERGGMLWACFMFGLRAFMGT